MEKADLEKKMKSLGVKGKELEAVLEHSIVSRPNLSEADLIDESEINKKGYRLENLDFLEEKK